MQINLKHEHLTLKGRINRIIQEPLVPHPPSYWLYRQEIKSMIVLRLLHHNGIISQTESTIGKTALTARDKEVTPMKSTTKGSPNKTDLSLKIAAYYSEGNDIQAKYSLTERASQSKTTEGENIQQQRPSTFKKGTNTANTYQLNQGIQQNLPPDGKPNQADNVANSQGEKIAQSQSKEIRSL